ncbi:tetratricopeptide repeat protein [Streptomyces sp. NPDC001407]|uniref:tetratricopeptide repeat protein n=1 Tax=Streptomyces sp. NPDC001407 TaxID=3364573 RepID=UPI0036C909A4
MARRDVEALPVFGEIPPRQLRLLTAASWGRADAVGREFSHLPSDLTTELWRQVHELSARPEDLTPIERDVAGMLMLRLDYPQRAARLLGITDAQMGISSFPQDVRPEHVLTRLAVLTQLHPKPAQVVSQALRAVSDPRLSVLTRLALASFAIPLQASHGSGSTALHQAIALAEQALTHPLDMDPEHRWVERKLLRSLSDAAIFRGEAAATTDYLDRAALSLIEVQPESALLQLAWDEEVFSAFQAQGRACRSINDTEGAVTATSRLPGISPYDADAWRIYGYTLLAAGRLDESLHAYEQMLPLGGHSVAAAAFHLGWIHEKRGDRKRAQDSYAFSDAIDPTVPAVNERLSSLQ